mmetsp:Transcript_31908/g.71860  ORF Transcript_31908/g.71860 Transcript_31908/m.71860 type:complete len:278 (-) Transcript_31908:28-861(-)
MPKRRRAVIAHLLVQVLPEAKSRPSEVTPSEATPSEARRSGQGGGVRQQRPRERERDLEEGPARSQGRRAAHLLPLGAREAARPERGLGQRGGRSAARTASNAASNAAPNVRGGRGGAPRSDGPVVGAAQEVLAPAAFLPACFGPRLGLERVAAEQEARPGAAPSHSEGERHCELHGHQIRHRKPCAARLGRRRRLLFLLLLLLVLVVGAPVGPVTLGLGAQGLLQFLPLGRARRRRAGQGHKLGRLPQGRLPRRLPVGRVSEPPAPWFAHGCPAFG